MVSIDEITTFFRGKIALSEPLATYTSFRIGGPADYYCEPADKEDAVTIIQYFRENKFPFVVLGKGTNLLVSDDGIRGAVINLEPNLRSLHVEGGRVFAEAGVSLSRFVDFCIQRGFKGVEMLAGIPGSIGGALMMNAGAYGGEIADHLVDVEVLREGKLLVLKKEELGFTYRHSSVREGDIVLSARFILPEGDRAEIMNIRRELLLKRNRAQPVNYPSSGCMFKNPEGGHAAKLIDQAGLKGTQKGQAQISEKHANFIINLGGATARDVMELIELARATVHNKFGITLELEVKLLGFSADRGGMGNSDGRTDRKY